MPTAIEEKLSMDVKEVLGNSRTYIEREYHGIENAWTEKNQAEKDEQMSYGDFDRYPLFSFPENPPKYYLSELLSGSDYSGGSVTVSNHRVFLEQFKEIDGVHDVYGEYGTYAIAIREDCLENEDIIEVLQRLSKYPVIDEEDMSMVEIECEQESWESFIKSDFRRELHKKFDEDDGDLISDMIDDISDENLWNFFTNKMEETNTYFEHETGCVCYVDIDRIINVITMGKEELK